MARNYTDCCCCCCCRNCRSNIRPNFHFRCSTTATTTTSLVLVFIATVTMSANIAHARIVDLSHDLDKDTYMAIPDMPFYSTKVFYKGEIKPGVFAEALTYTVSEHGGTHVDTPRHFSKDGYTLEQLPIESTVGDGIVIDCTQEVAQDSHYKLTLKKLLEWEEEHGEIPRQSAVVLNFNWSQYYKNYTLYLDPIDPRNASTFRFPSVGADAIDFLVDERDIKILAMDSMSPDLMNTHYPVHVKLAKKNKLLVENVKDPWQLPVKGFRFFASPVKFVGGTGVQTRVFALVEEEGCSGDGNGGAFISASDGCLVLAVVAVLEMFVVSLILRRSTF